MKKIVQSLIFAAITSVTLTHCKELPKYLKDYEQNMAIQTQASNSDYVRAYGFPLAVTFLPITALSVSTNILLYNQFKSYLVAMAGSYIVTKPFMDFTARWGDSRFEKIMAEKPRVFQEKLAHHYFIDPTLNQEQLTSCLERLTLLSDKQKEQIQVRALHTQTLFQDPSKMALLSNA